MEKRYKVYYGDSENDYIVWYLNKDDIIDGYLSELKAFELFYDSMVMCNNYLTYHYDGLEYLIDSYDDDDDTYADEYQVFIIDPTFSEDITIKATEKMGNTLYYDNELELYITGITDLGTHRSAVRTDIEVMEVE